MNCRFCGKALTHEFIDLVNAPPSNAFLTQDQLNDPEKFYPLKLFVCGACFLVQIDAHEKPEDIFNSGYAYFSSFSKTWLAHARQYANMMMERYHYRSSSLIVEIASNDGYLLQNFKQRGIPCLGIEPAGGTAAEAEKKGIETIVDFFDARLARKLVQQRRQADLIIGNNVLAHVPDLDDFMTGLNIALKPTGIITMEFPHLMQLMDNNQFDTIYHEHFSYLSFMTVRTIFSHYGLEIFDVEELGTHGGSLRIFSRHAKSHSPEPSDNINALLEKEMTHGLNNLNHYRNFQKKADQIKYDLLGFLIDQKKNGQKVAAYGAAAKGNTMLNYCGVKKDLIDFVADASPYKQGKYLPGSHIPVVSEESIRTYKPDYILILPWNIKEEIMDQIAYIKKWGARFVTAVPYLKVE